LSAARAVVAAALHQFLELGREVAQIWSGLELD